MAEQSSQNTSAIIYFAAHNSDDFSSIVCTIKSWTSEAFQSLPWLNFSNGLSY